MKIFTVPELFQPTSEMIILFGLLDKLPREQVHCYNHNNEPRYGNIISYAKQKYSYVSDPSECDIMVLPYKFKGTGDLFYLKLLSLADQYKKTLYCFYNDDNDGIFNIPTNVILFRTSFYGRTKLINEKPMICFSPDFFRHKYITDEKISIGYCGHAMHGREVYLETLIKSEIRTDFIIRSGFWAPNIDKIKARNDFFQNIENNLFNFCYRGAGNFSYRLYETMMMGRLPIFVNTDCVIPYWNIITSNNIGVIVDEKDILDDKSKIIPIIVKYYNDHKQNLLEIQKNNRRLWEMYYSPIGYLEHMPQL